MDFTVRLNMFPKSLFLESLFWDTRTWSVQGLLDGVQLLTLGNNIAYWVSMICGILQERVKQCVCTDKIYHTILLLSVDYTRQGFNDTNVH